MKKLQERPGLAATELRDAGDLEIDVLARAFPVVGFGATGITFGSGDADRTADAVALLAEAALVSPRRW